jgi:hypothetical protein
MNTLLITSTVTGRWRGYSKVTVRTLSGTKPSTTPTPVGALLGIAPVPSSIWLREPPASHRPPPLPMSLMPIRQTPGMADRCGAVGRRTAAPSPARRRAGGQPRQRGPNIRVITRCRDQRRREHLGSQVRSHLPIARAPQKEPHDGRQVQAVERHERFRPAGREPDQQRGALIASARTRVRGPHHLVFRVKHRSVTRGPKTSPRTDTEPGLQHDPVKLSARCRPRPVGGLPSHFANDHPTRGGAPPSARLEPFDAERARRWGARYLGSDERHWGRFRTGVFDNPTSRFVVLDPSVLTAGDLSF